MSKQQVNEIIKWLQDNYIDTTLSLDEVKELIEIECTAEPGIYGPSVENLPQSIIDEMEHELKISGEYEKYGNMVNSLKQKIENRLGTSK
jgi:hypothetical protein